MLQWDSEDWIVFQSNVSEFIGTEVAVDTSEPMLRGYPSKMGTILRMGKGSRICVLINGESNPINVSYRKLFWDDGDRFTY